MIDYKSIADRAVEIIGSADPAQYQTAYDAMTAETVPDAPSEMFESELSIMSRLGVALADTILTKIESAAPARVQRLIQSEKGINLADPQTQAMIAQLVAATVLTQEEADALLAPLAATKAKWPGLKPGYVQNAIEWRAEGRI